MGVRPDCDKGCRQYWENWWEGAVIEVNGLLNTAVDDLNRVQAELDATRRAYAILENVAKDWEAMYQRENHTSQQYIELFRRSIGLHDPAYRDE